MIDAIKYPLWLYIISIVTLITMNHVISEVTGIGSHDVEMVDQLSDELLHHLVHYK